MKTTEYLQLRGHVIERGYGSDIDWSESVRPPTDAKAFASGYAWVVLNSGMKNQVAERIWERVRPVLLRGGSASEVFGHPGKACAIDEVWRQREVYLDRYLAADDKLAFCRSLPWIGPITQWHLAKHYGLDVAKPDRHLVRIAEVSDETPTELCVRLSDETGDRVATVDMVVWRAANLGLVRVRAGELVFD